MLTCGATCDMILIVEDQSYKCASRATALAYVLSDPRQTAKRTHQLGLLLSRKNGLARVGSTTPALSIGGPMPDTTVPHDQSPRQLSTFVFNGQSDIRVIPGNDGEPRFIANDVCKAIALANVSQALSRLDDDEICDVILNDTAGRPNKFKAVTESGLYSLILRSDKSEAKAFKRWITSEVLPSIRKTGAYAVNLTPAETLLMQAQRLVDHERQIAALQENQRRIEARQDVQDQEREYFSIIGYAAYHKRHIDPTAASQLGKQATRYCKTHSIHIGKKKEALRGSVNTYPEDVLTLVFNAWRSQVPLLDD